MRRTQPGWPGVKHQSHGKNHPRYRHPGRVPHDGEETCWYRTMDNKGEKKMRQLNQGELDRKWKFFEEELADKAKPAHYQVEKGVKRMYLNRTGEKDLPVWVRKVGDGPWQIEAK